MDFRMHRRQFLTTLAAAGALPVAARFSLAAEQPRPLPIPSLVEAVRDPVTIESIAGKTAFMPGPETQTLGFSQSYLGPTLRFRRGEIARVNVKNRLGTPITCHWHGLHVPAIVDGGPALEVMPEKSWRPELEIDQPAATLWYHSHVHGRTGEQVYAGLAGMIIVDDPGAPDPGLPSVYGRDDLPLIIQDRAINPDGSLLYMNMGPAGMLGFRAGTVLVNGAVTPEVRPPAGLVRLRLLNGSNARIYHLGFADGRSFHQVASDAGLLPKPVPLTKITLAPAERVELLVDFSDGAPVALLSGADDNSPMSGGMGQAMRAMMSQTLPADPPAVAGGEAGEFQIMSFVPDKTQRSSVDLLPTAFPGSPKPDFGEPVRTRKFSLDMHAAGRGGGRGMGRGGGSGPMNRMGINGKSFSMGRVDAAMRRGETELWEIEAVEMSHPFHIHGTSFQVLSHNGRPVPFDSTGLKDVTVVNGTAKLLVKVDHLAKSDVPFMFHCHILEHEDAGMMGQFTVT